MDYAATPEFTALLEAIKKASEQFWSAEKKIEYDMESRFGRAVDAMSELDTAFWLYQQMTAKAVKAG
jgi:hypothetical protein